MRFFALIALVLLGACAPKTPPACRDASFEGSRFTVCTIDTARFDLRLMTTDRKGAPLRSLAAARKALGSRARRAWA